MDSNTFSSLTSADVNVTNELLVCRDSTRCLELADDYIRQLMEVSGDVPTFCLFMYTIVQRHIVKFVLYDEAQSCLTFASMICMKAFEVLNDYGMSYLIEYMFLPTEDNLIEHPNAFADPEDRYLVEVASCAILTSLTSHLGKLSDVISDRIKLVPHDIKRRVVTDVMNHVDMDNITAYELISLCK